MANKYKEGSKAQPQPEPGENTPRPGEALRPAGQSQDADRHRAVRHRSESHRDSEK